MKKALSTIILIFLLLLTACSTNKPIVKSLIRLYANNWYYIECRTYNKAESIPSIISYNIYLKLNKDIYHIDLNKNVIDSYYVDYDLYYTSNLLPGTQNIEYYNNGNYFFTNDNELVADATIVKNNLTEIKMENEIYLSGIDLVHYNKSINNNDVKYNIITNKDLTTIFFILMIIII